MKPSIDKPKCLTNLPLSLRCLLGNLESGCISWTLEDMLRDSILAFLENWTEEDRKSDSCIARGKQVCIYIYIPPHGPWFGAFDLYFTVLYVFFRFLDCVSKLGGRGCHIMYIGYSCMHTDLNK